MMNCGFYQIQAKMTTHALITFILISMSIMKISGEDSIEMEQIMPAYAIAKKFDILEEKSECRGDLETFKNSVDARKVWSLRMLDASGEPKPGFIHGNGFWLGIESQCYDIMNTKPLDLHPEYLESVALYRKPEEENSPYKLNYFSAYFSHSCTMQYQHKLPIEVINSALIDKSNYYMDCYGLQGFIILGLCLPASCSTDVLSMILRKISEERTLSISRIYDVNMTLLKVMDLKTDYGFLMNWRSIAVALIIIFTSVMIIAGTWYDLCIYRKRTEKKELVASNNKIQEEERKKDKDKKELAKDNPAEEKTEGITIGSVLMCFSAYTNSKDIFDVSSNGGPTACLHGLRVLSMFLLIALHVMFFSLDHTDNLTRLLRLSEKIPLQIISNGTFPVDTFFFMAGFLAAYVFFRNNMRKEKNKTAGFQWGEFFEAVMKRYFRLTPIFIVVMGIFEITCGYFAETSQFRRFEKPQEQCPKYWWRNILYIHNLFSYKELCASWTWYLADDMQFFIIATILLLISIKHLHIAAGIVIALLISSITITGYTAYDYNYVPTLDEYLPTLSLLYFPPWARIGPYLVGLATGYMIVNRKDKQNFSKKTVWFFWIVSIISLLLVQFGLYEKRISVLSASIYAAVSRIIWSLGIAWIVTACYTNNAGIVNKILAFKLWVPLSKLTYAAYLLNPIIISSINLLSESTFHLSILGLGISWIGFLVVTYIFSYVISVMFEMPFTLLAKLYFDRRRCK